VAAEIEFRDPRIAREFARQGADVVLHHAHSGAGAESAVAEIRARLPAHLDASAPHSVAALMGGAPLDESLRENLVAKVGALVKELPAAPA